MIDPLARLSALEQVKAVEQGTKPVCEVTDKFDTQLPYIVVPVVYREGDYSAEYEFYVYHRKETRAQAERAAEILAIDREWTREESIEFGRLMGYQEENIKAWVDKNCPEV